MDLKQIEYFIRIAELGSFTRASIELNVAQPALSRQIRLLEVELGQSLLIRTGRGVNTTEAGKVLLEHGHGVLHQIERVREELSRVRVGLIGRVAVGLPPSLTKILTVPLLKAFRAELPPRDDFNQRRVVHDNAKNADQRQSGCRAALQSRSNA